MFSFKKINIPESNKTTERETVQLWIVSWYSSYANGIAPTFVEEIEAFTDKEEALNFKESLENAFKLLKYKRGYWSNVDIKKN